MKRLAEVLKIHPGEERMATLIIVVMLFTSAGFTLGNTGVEALFFARFGVEFLPYMYMALGVLSFFITLGITALLGRIRHERLYMLLPIVMAAVLVGGWALLFTELNLIYPLLWLGMAVLDSLINLVIWGLASMICDTRQSKRLFPLFNTGRILGAVLGGFSTGLLVNWFGTENLLLVMAATMLIAFAAGRALFGQRTRQEVRPRRARRSQPSIIAEMQKGYQFVRRSELMRLVSVSAILFSVLYFSIALPFSKTATIQFENEDTLAGFLGLFNALSTGAAFLTSLFLANRLFARFGIMPMILLLPVIYLVGFGTLAVYEIFIVIVAFRFIQTLWITGIASSAWQTMFNPVPLERREQVRVFIEGVPSKAGTFIAGAILFVGEQTFTPQQLYIVGLVAAVMTLFVIWRAGRAYKLALVDALRAGRPTLFTAEEEPFGGFQQDATTIEVALQSMMHSDRLVRRTAAEILGNLGVPRAQDALVSTLEDPESEVKVVALKSLARAEASTAILEVAARLDDPEAEVRAQAIETLCSLTKYPHGLRARLEPLLKDSDALVRCRAAVGLLRLGMHAEARNLLRSMSVLGEQDDRIYAIQAIAEWGDQEAFALIENELVDQFAPSPVRRAAAIALGSCESNATPVLLDALSDNDPNVREGAVLGLSRLGPRTLDGVLTKLADPASEDGALQALTYLPATQAEGQLRKYAQERISSALRYNDLWRSVNSHTQDGPLQLLADSIRDHARHNSLKALKALSLLNDRETISVARDNLQSQNPNQRANALETLETIRDANIIRPMLDIWEPVETTQTNGRLDEILADVLEHEADNWLRACAAFAFAPASYAKANKILSHLATTDADPFVREVAAHKLQIGEPMDTIATLSIMERILLLRRVPLLADLPPADLKRVAAITTEHHFLDGEIIFEQDEPGDEMYVVVSGEVRVLVTNENHNYKEVARRKTGETVGEMSVISGDSRSASLVAAGDVHLLCLDQKSFEGLLRERPEVSLAVMRMLCERLRQATQRDDAQYS
ncbi:MAG: HEAT repeat domain-containing protein [Anaerolineales bacterium]|nr:HEAT repeat domain-containing protein [Anaerolineales bacterium]